MSALACWQENLNKNAEIAFDFIEDMSLFQLYCCLLRENQAIEGICCSIVRATRVGSSVPDSDDVTREY